MQKCDEKIGQKLSRIDYNQHKLPRIVKNNQELPPKIAIKWGYEFLLSDFQKKFVKCEQETIENSFST